MSELPRTRDCIILVKGDTCTVSVDESLAVSGWKGGQGVKWVESKTQDLQITHSDGLYAGFMLWGSDESSDQFTASTRNQPYYRFAVIGFGGWHILTSSYEKYTYTSRTGGGPLELIDYREGDKLLFSLRGYWTKEDEWTLSSDPRAPNAYSIGFLSQLPSTVTEFYMGVQVSI